MSELDPTETAAASAPALVVDLPSAAGAAPPRGVAADIPDDTPAPGSLQARLSAKRDELAAVSVVNLDVPGYEDTLVGRYKPLGYRTLRAISKRNEHAPDQTTSELYTACDTIIASCTDILLKSPDGELVSLECTWSPQLAALFEIRGAESFTPRQALFAILAPRPEQDVRIVVLYGQLMEAFNATNSGVDRQLLGE